MRKWKLLLTGLILTISLVAFSACGKKTPEKNTESATVVNTENTVNHTGTVTDTNVKENNNVNTTEGVVNGTHTQDTTTNGTTTNGTTTNGTTTNNGNVVEDVVDGVGEAGKDVINGVEQGVDNLTNNGTENKTTTDVKR